MVNVRIMSPAHGDMMHEDLTVANAAEVIMEEKREGRASFAKTDEGIHQLSTVNKLMGWLDGVKDSVVTLIPNIAGG